MPKTCQHTNCNNPVFSKGKYPKIFVGDIIKLCDIDYMCITGYNPNDRKLIMKPKYNKFVYEVSLINTKCLPEYPRLLNIKNIDLHKWGYNA